jgi:hypothetical protein
MAPPMAAQRSTNYSHFIDQFYTALQQPLAAGTSIILAILQYLVRPHVV